MVLEDLFFLCSFIFVTSPPIFLPVHICFTHPNDGWMGLYIKLWQNGKQGIDISGHLAELTDPDNINDTTCCNSHSRSNSEVHLVFGRKGLRSSAACRSASQCGDDKNPCGMAASLWVAHCIKWPQHSTTEDCAAGTI